MPRHKNEHTRLIIVILNEEIAIRFADNEDRLPISIIDCLLSKSLSEHVCGQRSWRPNPSMVNKVNVIPRWGKSHLRRKEKQWVSGAFWKVRVACVCWLAYGERHGKTVRSANVQLTRAFFSTKVAKRFGVNQGLKWWLWWKTDQGSIRQVNLYYNKPDWKHPITVAS